MITYKLIKLFKDYSIYKKQVYKMDCEMIMMMSKEELQLYVVNAELEKTRVQLQDHKDLVDFNRITSKYHMLISLKVDVERECPEVENSTTFEGVFENKIKELQDKLDDFTEIKELKKKIKELYSRKELLEVSVKRMLNRKEKK